jgi:DNA (cytosine-5)-methyltransferase 1
MNLPTPTVADTFTDQLKSSQQKEGSMHSVNLSQAVHMTWGRFEPAVKRWEEIIGHPAPAPTEPTGKDGAPRLSSKFTEWMMGLEPGWITDVGLSRKDELKACGNGVVPQQAKLALTMLKARFDVQ